MRVLFLLIATALGAFASPAAADVLCKTRKGAVTVRASCKPRETLLDPAALGIARGPEGQEGPRGMTGPTGPSGPTGVQGVTGATGVQGLPGSTGPQGVQGATGSPLAVKDANGALVGALLQETSPTADVYREVSSVRFRFSVGLDGFQTVGPGFAVNFDGVDCTGNAFMDAGSVTPTAQLLTQAYVHNNTLYSYSAPSILFTQRSQMFFPVGSVAPCSGGVSSAFIPPAACCRTFASGSPLTGYPVSTFDLNTLGLVTPFHIE